MSKPSDYSEWSENFAGFNRMIGPGAVTLPQLKDPVSLEIFLWWARLDASAKFHAAETPFPFPEASRKELHFLLGDEWFNSVCGLMHFLKHGFTRAATKPREPQKLKAVQRALRQLNKALGSLTPNQDGALELLCTGKWDAFGNFLPMTGLQALPEETPWLNGVVARSLTLGIAVDRLLKHRPLAKVGKGRKPELGHQVLAFAVGVKLGGMRGELSDALDGKYVKALTLCLAELGNSPTPRKRSDGRKISQAQQAAQNLARKMVPRFERQSFVM